MDIDKANGWILHGDAQPSGRLTSWSQLVGRRVTAVLTPRDEKQSAGVGAVLVVEEQAWMVISAEDEFGDRAAISLGEAHNPQGRRECLLDYVDADELYLQQVITRPQHEALKEIEAATKRAAAAQRARRLRDEAQRIENDALAA